jgi:hypothetical protein
MGLFGGWLLPLKDIQQVRVTMWLYGGIPPYEFERFLVPEYRYYYRELIKKLEAEAKAKSKR